MENLKNILPEELVCEIQSLQKPSLYNMYSVSYLTEIRLRIGQYIIFKFGKEEYITKLKADAAIIYGILGRVTDNSIYAVQNNLNQGYITACGGIRIGITGEVVIIDGKIKNIKNLSSMNIRVARQVLGAANPIFKYVYSAGMLHNTLIVSPPGCGKTTMLRDVIRQISLCGKNIGVVDERGEIASCYSGVPNLDVGPRTDVISGVSKAVGINMLVRSMGIDLVATDEIGEEEEFKAIKYAVNSGVKLLFTMHGLGFSDVLNNMYIKKYIDMGYFDTIIILSNKEKVGGIEKIYVKDENCTNFREVGGYSYGDNKMDFECTCSNNQYSVGA